MKVIICGIGRVGWQLARNLVAERYRVTVIDTNPELVRAAARDLDVDGVEGPASHPDVLERAGAAHADWLIAATHSDEVNILACHMAKAQFSIGKTFSRLRSRSYIVSRGTPAGPLSPAGIEPLESLPIDVAISPEQSVAAATLQHIGTPGAFDTQPFFGGGARLLGLRLGSNCPVLNTPLSQLTDLFNDLNAVVVAVRRNGKTLVPEAGDQLFEDDEAYVFASAETVPRTLRAFDRPSGRIGRLVIVGGGSIGLLVAQSLETSDRRERVRVIERGRARAEVAADALIRTVVLNGDGLDANLLAEAEVHSADAILTVTNDDKTNMLAAVRAKSMGCPFSLALINDPTLLPLLKPLGIDSHINLYSATVSSMLKHLRHKSVSSVYSIGNAEAEMIEFEVARNSPMAGAELRNLDLPEGALVAGAMRGGLFVAPAGDLRINAGDVVALFSLRKDVERVAELMGDSDGAADSRA